MILRIVPIHRRKIGAPPRAAPFGVVPPKRSASAWVWQSESIHLEFTTNFFYHWKINNQGKVTHDPKPQAIC